MKGGSARPVMPFLKRTGFLASDEPKLLGARNRSEAPALARARGRL